MRAILHSNVSSASAQRGSVLFISLILLVAMTMIAVASARVSTTQLGVVGNAQSVQLVESAAQLGVEEVMERQHGHSIAKTRPCEQVMRLGSN